MQLADKIMEERKKLGLSQEELAEKLSVSRQAVSKWESAQSVPDLPRILAMSELFSVSTDYLLKDSSPEEERTAPAAESSFPVRRLTQTEADLFLEAMSQQSRTVSFGVVLCILSPVLLILLAGFSEAHRFGITETVAAAVGLSVLLLMVAAAVFLFIRNSVRTERFSYLLREDFETVYGVSERVREKKTGYGPIYAQRLSLGVFLCILSPLPLILVSVLIGSEELIVYMTDLLLCTVAAAVCLIVRACTVMSGYDILLQEGDYRKDRKRKNRTVDAVSGAYWGIATAVYLAWSFLSMDWDRTWILWPVAAVLFAPVMLLVRLYSGDREKTGK